MRKLTYKEIFASRPKSDELARQKRFPIYGLIENIRSLYNVGSIFRTSDAVKLQKLYITGYSGYPPRREIEKTALGATQTVPWEYHKDPMDAIQQLKKKGVKLIALEHTTKSNMYMACDFEFPICLLVGNEVEGLSEQLIDQADLAIEIPMYGLKQSLNVSVAYGIVVYFALQSFLAKEIK